MQYASLHPNPKEMEEKPTWYIIWFSPGLNTFLIT